MKPSTGRRPGPLATRVWGNPMARPVDRSEAAWTWVLLVIWVLAVPLLAVIGSTQWTNLQAQAASQSRSLTSVQATLLQDASYELSAYRSIPTGVTAQATWVGPTGLPVTGAVTPVPGAHAGDHITIWLGPDGSVVDPPLTGVDATVEAVLIAVSGWLGFGLLLVGLWWLLRARLDRRRWSAWAQEWERFERNAR